MALEAGTRLGPYEILLFGSGVWAIRGVLHHTKLGE
jgi:hypothetical protein